MKILVNVFHPNLERSTVNKVLVEAIKGIPNITIRDLYREYRDLTFRDKIPMASEKEHLVSHDRIVFQHPVYWYSIPPLFKKWIEDVIDDSWAWGPHSDQLAGKEWLGAVTCAGDVDSYRPGNFNGYSLDEYLRPLQQTASLCHMHYRPLFSVRDVFNLSDEALQQEAERYKTTILSEQLSREFEL